MSGAPHGVVIVQCSTCSTHDDHLDRETSARTITNMPRRSGPPGSPSDWIAEGEWPDGDFKADTPSVVVYAVEIARALDEALKGQVRSHVAQSAGIERSTLYDILAGKTWPDMVTLAKLEQALSVTLWPTDLPPLPRTSDAGPAAAP